MFALTSACEFIRKTLYRAADLDVRFSIEPMPMQPSRLEDRVRELCDRAIAAKSQTELDKILPELKAAIKDHIRYVRDVAAETIPEVFGSRSNAAD